MKIQSRNVINAPRDRVWAAINDPAVLARTLPGCESLEVVDDGHYKATVTAGVASIRGTYSGDVRLSDQVEPSSLTMAVQGAGSAGTIGADVDVAFEAADDGATAVLWDADAVVGGMIGGVGQRMLAGVSKRMAGEFFANLEADITGVGVPAEAVDDAAAVGEPATAGAGVAGDGMAGDGAGGVEPGTVLQGSVSRTGASGTIQVDDTTKFVAGMVAGAAIALLGVLVGRRLR